jgi:hypothetical protein
MSLSIMTVQSVGLQLLIMELCAFAYSISILFVINAHYANQKYEKS